MRLIKSIAAVGSVFVVTGCDLAEVRKDEDFWMMNKGRLIGFQADDFVTCAGPAFLDITQGNTRSMKYGFIRQLSMAHVKCELSLFVRNGTIESFRVDSENPGGLTSGEQMCAFIIDPCFGDGTRLSLSPYNDRPIASTRQAAAVVQNTRAAQGQGMQEAASIAQQIAAARSQPQTAPAQPSGVQSVAPPLSNDAELQALRAKLAEQESRLQALNATPTATTLTQTQQAAPTLPPSAPQRPQAPARVPAATPEPATASFKHSHTYHSDGGGGLVYVVSVENDGDVTLICDVVVKGITWNSDGRSLQQDYSDRRRLSVHPGRSATAGFDRAVANSGSYEVTCARN